MTVTVTRTLKICHSCACVQANGELVEMGPEGYYDAAEEKIAKWVENGIEPMTLVLACGSDDEYCATNCEGENHDPCEACGDTTPGWRHEAAILTDTKKAEVSA